MSPLNEKYRLGHLSVSAGDLCQILSRVRECVEAKGHSYCIPINVTKYGLSRKDSKLCDAINAADLVIADGVPMVCLARRFGHADVHRVTGIELAEALMGLAASKSWRVYFLGASQENLDTAVGKLQQRFANLQVCGRRNGFFRDEDLPLVVDEINRAEPDVLLLGLGLPQKEYFVADQFDELRVPFCLTVGGAFDIWSGAKKRTPVMLQRVGLEWLYRSFYDVGKGLTLMRHGAEFVKDFLRGQAV